METLVDIMDSNTLLAAEKKEYIEPINLNKAIEDAD